MLPRPFDFLPITSYGLMLLLGLVVAWWYARKRAMANCMDVSHIDLALPLTFLVGIVGAWLFSKISPGDILIGGEADQPQNRFRLFGFLCIALPALFVYCKLAKLDYRRVVDVFALPMVLFLACLRVGCFLAGCCWGDVAENLGVLVTPFASQIQTVSWLAGDWIWWAVSYPQDSLAYQQQITLGLIGSSATESLAVHPTQLYEMVYVLLLWMVLRSIEIRPLSRGCLAITAIGGYALGRFVIEFLRADSELIVSNLSFTQLLCAVLLVGCIFGYGRVRRRA